MKQKNPMLYWALGLIFWFPLSILGCSSLHKDAEILMEGEEYGEAEKVYAQILDSDFKDPRAIVGIKKARTKWIDKKLLDVRMLRLSGQAVPANELLKRIIDREREWQFYPEGAVQYTQEEETQYAVQLIAAQVSTWRSQGHLLKARALLNGYEPIFATSKLVVNLGKLNEQLRLSARDQCHSYQRDLNSSLPYLAIFLRRYCGSWGQSVDAGFDPIKQRASTLFNDLKVVENSLDGIPEPLQAQGRNHLIKEFQKTAWHAPEASLPLNVVVSAGFGADHKKVIEQTVHSYTVKVPYTKMVEQTRTVPHTVSSPKK